MVARCGPFQPRNLRRWHAWLAIPVLGLGLGCQAAEFRGQVVGVLDGGTLDVLTPAKTLVRIRLAEIDAPEKSQPFGQRSKQNLSDLCFAPEATLVPSAPDRCGRTIARVRCRGRAARLEQVRGGLAWA